MYVCICNALKDRQLAMAAEGAVHVAEVFKKCGARPRCGKCLPDVADLIEEANEPSCTEVIAAE